MEAGGTRMFQILNNAMIEIEGNVMRNSRWKMVFTAL
jgi:hypothetical protein